MDNNFHNTTTLYAGVHSKTLLYDRGFTEGTGGEQTVNLLALRLQWFESTPAQASPRAILQVLKPLGG